MTTRSPRIAPPLAAAGVLLLLVLAVCLAAVDGPEPSVQPSPERAGFHIQDTNLGVFLVDSRTGDTRRWYANLEAGRIGWQHFVRPSRVHTCSMDAELPELSGLSRISGSWESWRLSPMARASDNSTAGVMGGHGRVLLGRGFEGVGAPRQPQCITLGRLAPRHYAVPR